LAQRQYCKTNTYYEEIMKKKIKKQQPILNFERIYQSPQEKHHDIAGFSLV